MKIKFIKVADNSGTRRKADLLAIARSKVSDFERPGLVVGVYFEDDYVRNGCRPRELFYYKVRDIRLDNPRNNMHIITLKKCHSTKSNSRGVK